VAINEAIELAKSFGTEDSKAFINGILDRIWNSTKSDARDQGARVERGKGTTDRGLGE
jgi:transcription antitermination protein NusB